MTDLPCATVLVVSDGDKGPSATQMISFHQPFIGAQGPRFVFEGDRPIGGISAKIESRLPQLLILSRCANKSGGEWIAAARTAGIPVVFHIDDDLLAVPPSLGDAKFRAYNDPARLAALRANIEASDLLYVSTSALKDRFEEHGIAIPIIAGDVYCSVSPDEIGALVSWATGPVIGYMGTSGHAADLAEILPAIATLMDELPELQFELFGTIRRPAELARFGDRVRHLPAVSDYEQFRTTLRSLGWWVGLAPLEDNTFNRCKADTKWVEYSLAGMAVVAADLPVYERAAANGAGLLARSVEQWTSNCRTLLLRPEFRRQMVGRAQNKLREIYSHTHLRAQVLGVLDQAFTNRPN